MTKQLSMSFWPIIIFKDKRLLQHMKIWWF